MSFLDEDADPLVVFVKKPVWNAFGEPTSLKAAYLLGFLQGAGGVNENVEDGFYHFNIEQVGDTLVTSLEPVQED